jgi:uncharacterized protein with HEPN domain
MKRSNSTDKERLNHIILSIDFIAKYTYNINEDEFLRDEILKRAMVRELEVIGEAANYLTNEIYENYAEVSWPKIISLRNRLIHEYMEVNYRTVWEIIQEELSNLKINIQAILLEI